MDVTLRGSGSATVTPGRIQISTVMPAPASVTAAADRNTPVAGVAVTSYPGSGRSTAQEFAAHEGACGKVGCYRSYSSSAHAWPTTWAGLSTTSGSTIPQLGDWRNRWSWHSVKPPVAALVAGTDYTNVRNFIASIPVTGHKRLITCWHEMDVGGKIPGNASYSQTKQMWYEFGRAVKDEGHPDVLYGPIFGSKFTISEADTIMAATWSGQTTASSTTLLRSVVDFVAWDPYNEASHSNNYASGFQGDTGAAFYLDACVAWNATNFPAARFAIGEYGMAPQASDLTKRPAWIQAVNDYCAALTPPALAVCYYDASVGRANWIRVYETVRNDTSSFATDAASVAKWSAMLAAYPPYVS